MKKARCWPICLMTLLIAPAIMISSAWAKKEPPKIETAVVTEIDAVTYSIDISGENFLCDDPDALEVWIGGNKVEVYSLTTEQQLIFTTPAGLAGPGSYLMTLLNGCGKDDYEVTVGAVGSQGSTGPPGDPGEDGVPGADWTIDKIYSVRAENKDEVACEQLEDKVVGGGAYCGFWDTLLLSEPLDFRHGTLPDSWHAKCLDEGIVLNDAVNPSSITVICVRP